MALLGQLLLHRPGLAWIGAVLTFTFGTLPSWLLDLRDLAALFSVVGGLIICALTIAAQLDARRERRRQIAELERARLDPRGQPWGGPHAGGF